jgi:hypothetical protein
MMHVVKRLGKAVGCSCSRLRSIHVLHGVCVTGSTTGTSKWAMLSTVVVGEA